VILAIVLLSPFYFLMAHLIITIIGLYEFANAHNLHPSKWTVLQMVLGYLPYQWVLGYAALRATVRELRGVNNWEKTAHVGAHRQPTHAT